MTDDNQIVQAGGEGELVVTRPQDAAGEGAMLKLAEGLPQVQQRALMLLSEGQSISRAAVNAGINRGTLHRWIKSDPQFRAAYNAWQMEQRESCRAGLLKAAEGAVATLARSVQTNGNLAFRLLKEMGLMAGPGALRSEPGEVKQEMEIEALEAENRLDSRHFKRLIEKIRLRRDLEQIRHPRNDDDDEFDDDVPPAPVGDSPQAVAQLPEPAPTPAARQAPRKERLSDVETRIG